MKFSTIEGFKTISRSSADAKRFEVKISCNIVEKTPSASSDFQQILWF